MLRQVAILLVFAFVAFSFILPKNGEEIGRYDTFISIINKVV